MNCKLKMFSNNQAKNIKNYNQYRVIMVHSTGLRIHIIVLVLRFNKGKDKQRGQIDVY